MNSEMRTNIKKNEFMQALDLKPPESSVAFFSQNPKIWLVGQHKPRGSVY
jgi:hypothetical protein